MKMPVAMIERGDNRAMPQTPWPDVQPLLSSGAEADQEAGDGNDSEARRHLRNWHCVAEQRGAKRRRDEPDDKSGAPGAIAALRLDQAGKDSGHAGDTSIETHQQYGGKTDQCAANRRGDRSEIGHALPRGEGSNGAIHCCDRAMNKQYVVDFRIATKGAACASPVRRRAKNCVFVGARLS